LPSPAALEIRLSCRPGGLIDPPYGYVWVRYGPDALLVNVENGLILSVMYGVFV
jgi:Ni/Co efflux regulator RcnB